MKICLFHPKLLPPRDYGGVERVVLWLAKGLVERGHEVWVGALEGSQLPPGARLLAFSREQSSAWELLKRLPAGVDVVHWMAPPEEGVCEKLPCASLLTVHGNGKPGEIFPLNTVFLSRDHARRHGAEAFVYNGIDPAEYRFEPGASRDGSLLFLSKTSWSVKNLGGAIRICSQAGASLKIAGGNRPWGRRLQAAISPRMNWVGAVGGEKKARLLAEARALVFPVLWPEPFGLVVVEALISGTPVLASRRGSLPELVTSDVGALLESPEDANSEKLWVEKVSELARDPALRWCPEACRARALEHFHYLKMAEGYENAYNKVTTGAKLHQSPPVAGDWRAQANDCPLFTS